MAIIANNEKRNLKLQFDDGLVGDKQKLISKTLTKVKVDALDQALYDAAKALEGLQGRQLMHVKRVEEIVLVEE